MSFSFGTPSSAPATGLSSSFSFGANKPATPGFGLGATTQPSTGLFGTPATSAPAFGTTTPAFGSTSAFGATSSAPAFGASSTPAFGATSTAPAFGATTTPAFGASATPAFGATATPAFGATSAAPAFGATSSAPAFGATTTPAFGATTTPAFGATTSAPAFGATATPAFGATSTAPAFGSTAPSFGASSGAPAFGTTTPAFGAGNTSFGAGLGTGGLSFATTTAASTGLSFGTTTTTSSGLGGLGGFGFGATTTQSGIGLFAASTTTAASSSFATTTVGLGGSIPTSGTAGATDGKTEPPKQTKLPNEIATPVESFKEFVKKQKSLSSDIMRVSIKPLQKVSRDAECTLRSAQALAGETARCRAHSRRLRAAAAAALAAADAAARAPPGHCSELEGITPPAYVKELISELEQQIITFRRQMDVADKQMQSSPKLLTEQELTLGIRRMHESLVALAGRLQAVHSQVEAQKEQYLNLRKYVLKDPTNVFDNQSANASLDQILRDAEGTRKKTKSGTFSDIGLSSAVLSDPRAALGNIQHLAGPTPFTYLGSTLSSFPAADTSGSSWQPTPQPTLSSSVNTSFGAPTDGFQLQKPPGKRGKQ